MKYFTFFIICVISIILSCKTESNDCLELEITKSGFYQEKNENCKDNLQNQDNKIYVKSLKVLYEISYRTNEFSYVDFNPKKTNHLYMSWEFSDEESPVIRYLELVVTGNSINSCQTEIEYRYLSESKERLFSEITGVVENCKNIWIHNPRYYLFQKCYIGVWPYFQLPFQIGKTWEYGWKFNSILSNIKHITWEGVLDTRSTYIVTDKEKLLINNKYYETYVVNASFSHDLNTYQSIFYVS
ncbi:MAG TPA: hypothetical protein PKC30_07715 [Saprospiraceae bacterium]|nr:hypothetical protein [Saprospiraceae bacterium]